MCMYTNHRAGLPPCLSLWAFRVLKVSPGPTLFGSSNMPLSNSYIPWGQFSPANRTYSYSNLFRFPVQVCEK